MKFTWFCSQTTSRAPFPLHVGCTASSNADPLTNGADYSESDIDGEDRGLPSGELEDYAKFIRREMPTLVRRELETLFQDEFQDVEEHVRPRIAEIVLGLQPRLLGLYKQSQLPLSDYGPQQHHDSATGSEPTLTPLLSPGTGTAPGSTPDTVLGVDSLFPAPDLQLGFYTNGLDVDWGTLYPGDYTQAHIPEADAGLGLNWDVEFDKLLNPTLFLPAPGEMQPLYSA